MLLIFKNHFLLLIIWIAIIWIAFYELFLYYKRNIKIKQILDNIKYIVNKYNKQNIWLINKFLNKVYKKKVIDKKTMNRLSININIYIAYEQYYPEEFKEKDIYYLNKLYQFIIENSWQN